VKWALSWVICALILCKNSSIFSLILVSCWPKKVTECKIHLWQVWLKSCSLLSAIDSYLPLRLFLLAFDWIEPLAGHGYILFDALYTFLKRIQSHYNCFYTFFRVIRPNFVYDQILKFETFWWHNWFWVWESVISIFSYC